MAMSGSGWGNMDASTIGKFGTAAGIGGVGAGLASMFLGGDTNPGDSAMKYLNQVQGATSPYYQPYINAGSQAIPQLQGQYSSLLNNPGQKINQIGSNYQQSPGFQFALQQALQGANHGAAAGGMAGSPQNQQQNMQLATQLGNQDYYNWLGHAQDLYGAGLQGTQGIYQGGIQSSNDLATQIAQALNAQATAAYQGQAAQNQAQGSMFGNIANGIGDLAAFAGL